MKLLHGQSLFMILLAVFILLVYLLSPILTPFLLGALLAYLADPLVRWLDKRHVPHVVSVILVFTSVFALLALLILMLVPFIQQQMTLLIEELPKIIHWVETEIIPWLQKTVNLSAVTDTLSSNLPKAGSVLRVVLHSGGNMVDAIVSCVLTPVVTFYLLRDWNKILTGIKRLLPVSSAPTIIKLAKQSDEILGAFFRGQLLIMLALCLIYGIGLSLVGLQLGLIIGLIGGVLSIVPYLGSIFVVVAASIASLVQFGTWQSIIPVLIIYLIGQTIEGYVLTPYLIGRRIGLHPVAVIFAIMAGGTLFGFFGVLLALPVAAVLMVFVRYAVR